MFDSLISCRKNQLFKSDHRLFSKWPPKYSKSDPRVLTKCPQSTPKLPPGSLIVTPRPGCFFCLHILVTRDWCLQSSCDKMIYKNTKRFYEKNHSLHKLSFGHQILKNKRHLIYLMDPTLNTFLLEGVI